MGSRPRSGRLAVATASLDLDISLDDAFNWLFIIDSEQNPLLIDFVAFICGAYYLLKYSNYLMNRIWKLGTVQSVKTAKESVERYLESRHTEPAALPENVVSFSDADKVSAENIE